MVDFMVEGVEQWWCGPDDVHLKVRANSCGLCHLFRSMWVDVLNFGTVLTMGRNVRRMHTVPAGYLKGFAIDPHAARPRVWRFEREIGQMKQVGVLDAGVVKDIYSIKNEFGERDTAIETDLLRDIDGAFCGARESLVTSGDLRYWQWRDLFRFMALQMSRTPRQFQCLRDELARAQGSEYDPDLPQKLMVLLSPQLENWLCFLGWVLVRNESDVSFLTSDNPVTMFADRGDGFEVGVGFEDPMVHIQFPLCPRLCLLGSHRADSRTRILADHDEASFEAEIELHCSSTESDIDTVKRINLVTAANADRHLYGNCNDPVTVRFLEARYFGRPAPVRRLDRRPFGSPVQPTNAPCSD